MGVWDDLFATAKSVTNSAAKKTDELVKISKLKMTSAQINGDIKTAYERLGRTVYDGIKADTDNPSAIARAVGEVDDLYRQLESVTAKLEELQDIRRCPKCDEKNKDDAVFCAKCGARLIAAEEPPDEDFPFTATSEPENHDEPDEM